MITHCHKQFPGGDLVVLEPGEKNKTLDTARRLYEQFLHYEMDRTCFVLGIGGGVICDITGYVASTFMRGVPFGFMATTLLAQVDAAIGGKNGVNLLGYKNMIGVVNQPDFVLSDPLVLKTLTKKEYVGGFAEVIKYGAIFDKEILTFLKEKKEKVFDYDLQVLEELVYKCALVKSGIVEKDEFDQNERKKLNFGHTFAHAFEKVSGVSHGEAVSLGMILASRLSVHMGFLSKQDAIFLEELLLDFELPVSIDINKDEVFEAVKKDKKKEGNMIRMILLNNLGNAVLKRVDIDKIKTLMNDLC